MERVGGRELGQPLRSRLGSVCSPQLLAVLAVVRYEEETVAQSHVIPEDRRAWPGDEVGQRRRSAGRAVALPQLDTLGRGRRNEVKGTADDAEEYRGSVAGRSRHRIAYRLRPLRRAVALPEDGPPLGVVRHEVEAVLEGHHMTWIHPLRPRDQVCDLIGPPGGTVAAPQLRTVGAVGIHEQQQAEARHPAA